MQSDNSLSKGRQTTICPFLGLIDDPETTISYPSVSNCCHHARPVSAVSFEQQQKFCLREESSSCPIFQKEKPGPLPKNIRLKQPGVLEKRPWIPLIALVSLLIAGIILSYFLGIIRVPSSPVVETPLIVLKSPTVNSISPTTLPPRSSATPSPTITQTEIPPTLTPTQQNYRLLETPLPEYPYLMIHRLKDGEGLNLLAQLYQTTSTAIAAVNYNLPPVLWINSLVVIPVGSTDVSGYPRFSAFEIPRTGISIEEFAQSNQLDPVSLKKYNSLPDGYILTQGEWLLIPHSD